MVVKVLAYKHQIGKFVGITVLKAFKSLGFNQFHLGKKIINTAIHPIEARRTNKFYLTITKVKVVEWVCQENVSQKIHVHIVISFVEGNWSISPHLQNRKVIEIKIMHI